MAVEVVAVTTRRERREFVDLPFRLHANAPQWCPPLRAERRLYLSRRFNAFFRHGDAQLFLARRDGRVVGRISAQIDHAYNRCHDSAWGWFGFIELEDDQEAAGALLDAAEAWLRERGMERMVGPADFTMNEESGIVIEGHELPAMIKQPWHPPYYQRLSEGAGLEKAMDLLMWNLEVTDRKQALPVLFDLAEQVGLAPRHHAAQDVAPAPARRDGPLRRGLQRGVGRQLGLRAVRQGRPRPVRHRDADRLRARLVHGRREGRRDGGRRDQRPGPQRGPATRAGFPAALLVAVAPSPPPDRPCSRGLPRDQARVPAHRRRRRLLRRALRRRRAPPAHQGRRDRLDPRDATRR